MEGNRVQPRDILHASNIQLRRKFKWFLAIIIFLGLVLLVNIIISSVYISSKYAQINEL